MSALSANCFTTQASPDMVRTNSSDTRVVEDHCAIPSGVHAMVLGLNLIMSCWEVDALIIVVGEVRGGSVQGDGC